LVGRGVNIAVAIPARNEERTIASVVALTRRIIPNVIVINDGSTDRTGFVARAAGAHVVNHRTNRGKGAAIETAFSWARATGVDVLVLLDGDGQHDPREIPKLLDPVLKGEADIAVGSRWISEEGLREMPSHRRLGNTVLTFMTRMAGGAPVKDTQSGFRAFGRKAIRELRINALGFEVESTILIQARQRNMRVVEVPIRCRYGNLEANTERSSSHGFRVLNYLLRLLRTEKPLKYFLLLSIPFLSGTGYFAYRLFEFYKENGYLYVGYAFLTIAGITLSAFIIYAGLILQAINRRSYEIIRKIENLSEVR